MPDAPHTLRRVQAMLGLSRSAIAGLIADGFRRSPRADRATSSASPSRTSCCCAPRTSLQAADIPPRKILRSLARLKATLPAELPLTGLRITAVGSTIAVRDRDGQWEAERASC